MTRALPKQLAPTRRCLRAHSSGRLTPVVPPHLCSELVVQHLHEHSSGGFVAARGMEAATPPGATLQPPDADLDFLASGTLERRRGDEGAPANGGAAGGGGGTGHGALPPGRQFVFRRNADYDSLIEACSRKLVVQPNNVRALMIRANSYLKKGGCRRVAWAVQALAVAVCWM